MKTKIVKYGLAATALLASVTACNDEFLTREPQGQYSPAALKSAGGVEGLLLGAYAMVDGQGLDGQAPWNNDIQSWVFGGIASDDAYKGTDSGDQPEQSFIEKYDFQPNNGHITNKWRGLYKGIARTNDVLNTLKEVPNIPETRRKQIVAEARFLRGLFHFEAQKMWKTLPYIGDETFKLDDLESTKVPNAGPIWDKIEADFKAAVDALPESQAEVGRPTRYAAMGFLAKAYMYQGWDVLTGAPNTAKLTAAKPLLEAIIASGKYSLMPRFDQNFLIAFRNNAESIWEVQYAVSSAADGAADAGVGLATPTSIPGAAAASTSRRRIW